MKIVIAIDNAVYDALPERWRAEAILETRIEEVISGIVGEAELFDVEIQIEFVD